MTTRRSKGALTNLIFLFSLDSQGDDDGDYDDDGDDDGDDDEDDDEMTDLISLD